MARILIKNTIAKSDDDWSVAGLSILQSALDGAGFHVEARDRLGDRDPDLMGLAQAPVDQLWLFALDAGDGLSPAEVEAVAAFQRRGGALMITRDHFDMGACVCDLGFVGAAHHFHTRNPETDPARRRRDDPHTLNVDWPNYHSGANGDAQTIEVADPLHPIMAREDGSPLKYLPAHPHEGAVSAPAGAPARVIAYGQSLATGARFALGVANEAHEAGGVKIGRSFAHASFHHFADYNFDPDLGCPSFVSEPPAYGLKASPEALADAKRYPINIARWLAAQT